MIDTWERQGNEHLCQKSSSSIKTHKTYPDNMPAVHTHHTWGVVALFVKVIETIYVYMSELFWNPVILIRTNIGHSNILRMFPVTALSISWLLLKCPTIYQKVEYMLIVLWPVGCILYFLYSIMRMKKTSFSLPVL